MTAETIEITPTWRGIMPLLVELAANADSAEARKNSMDQLLKLADVIDAFNEEARKKKDEGETPEKDPHAGFVPEDVAFDAMYILLGANRMRHTTKNWADLWSGGGHLGMAEHCLRAAKIAGQVFCDWQDRGNHFESVYAYDVAEPLGEWLSANGPVGDEAIKAQTLHLIQKA